MPLNVSQRTVLLDWAVGTDRNNVVNHTNSNAGTKNTVLVSLGFRGELRIKTYDIVDNNVLIVCIYGRFGVEFLPFSSVTLVQR